MPFLFAVVAVAAGLAAGAVVACSRAEAIAQAPEAVTTVSASPKPVVPAVTASPLAAGADSPPIADAASAAPLTVSDAGGDGGRFDKRYKVVLQTGDSMVGGGLCRALQPRFTAEGSRFIRDVWESGSIENFADADRLQTLLKRYDPDLVLLTMGANDVGGNVTDYLAKKIEKVAAITQRGHARDCIWIGPPKWRINGKPVVDMIRAHAGPCYFFDSTDIEMHRKEDKVHPDERGGEEWAAVFWQFLRNLPAPVLLDGGPLLRSP
jgi:lysophospholipase L1-like esterase